MSTQPPEGTPSSAASPPQFQVRIPLEWASASDIPILYANQLMVSHIGPEFFLTFGAVLPPTQSDALPDSLIIEPQLRVAIAREAMPAIVKALNDSLARFQAVEAQRRRDASPEAPGAPPVDLPPSPAT